MPFFQVIFVIFAVFVLTRLLRAVLVATFRRLVAWALGELLDELGAWTDDEWWQFLYEVVRCCLDFFCWQIAVGLIAWLFVKAFGLCTHDGAIEMGTTCARVIDLGRGYMAREFDPLDMAWEVVLR